MSRTILEQAALRGFEASSAYDAHRPSYPPEAVDQLLSALKVIGAQGASVADLAAGTGKFTELIAARPEEYSVVAIEPHKSMRAELERKSLKGVTVARGTAEDMPEIAGGTFDALIASQVWAVLSQTRHMVSDR
jgi:ubiquinone/menaquinone biosynthesis C-methylase UbiE